MEKWIMLPQRITDILQTIKVPIDDPRFFTRVFIVACRARAHAFTTIGDNIKRVCAEEYDELSRRFDRSNLQESCAVRNILRCRRLANLLVNDKGQILVGLIPKVIQNMENFMYSLGPNRQYDAPRNEQIINALKALESNNSLVKKIQRIGKPYNHKFADQIIRETVGLPKNEPITDAYTRRAVLSAWLSYLRQNVGSCFATAPSIIVHDEQPGAFLDDIIELMTTGQLKRTFNGIEYSVPLSKSWGAGDLKRSVYIPREIASGQSDLWLSPGLLSAFEEVKLIDENLPLQQKIKLTKKLIVDKFSKDKVDQPYLIQTPEDIIRGVLLLHFKLTEEDIKEFENRPTGLIQGGYLMQLSTGATSEKNKQCTHFLDAFEEAKTAFKKLADNALLKSWEFTVASFAETKAQFTRWNLYSSLGLAPDDRGGIGPCIFQLLKRKLDETNRKTEDLQIEYEHVYNQLKMFERRIKTASSEKEAQWIRIEYQSRANEFRTLEELRDRMHFKASRFANLFNVLVDIYYTLFPKYFQEIYDADMHDVSAGPYDDSPAGFRLIYKHGRSSSAQWTAIQDQHQFIDALSSFFNISEIEIVDFPEMKGLEDDISQIVSAIVSHVRTDEFLETAFYRMAAIHNAPIPKNPLQNIDKLEKKPWVYTSGGAMNTLVSCYFGREDNPTEISRWVENPMELLVWLIDVVKQMPENISQTFIKNPQKSLLIHSPTHAFLFKPGFYPFSELWQSKKFTYTNVRDNLVSPLSNFVDKLWIDHETSRKIIQELKKKIPIDYRELFENTFSNITSRLSSVQYRDLLINKMLNTPGLRYGRGAIISPDIIDSTLFNLLPYTPGIELKGRIKEIFDLIPDVSDDTKNMILEILDEIPGASNGYTLYSAQQLQDICKILLILAYGKTSVPFDANLLISHAAQELGYAFPTAIIFADTNWVKDLFSFVVNPGTGKLELWRVDYTSREGSPMSMWEHYLDGSSKKNTWGVYTRFQEYIAKER